MRELDTMSHGIAADLRVVLGVVDGRASVANLRHSFDYLSPGEVEEALAQLVAADFICAVSPLPGGDESAPSAAQDDESLRAAQALRAKLKGRRRGEQRAAAEADAEEQARREAEEQARRDAEEARRVEEEARRKAEEEARQAAERQARQAAEEQARRDAEQQARQAAEEQSRSDAERKAAGEAAERARQDAETQARLAEQQAWRENEQERKRKREAVHRRRAQAQATRTPETASTTRLRWGRLLAAVMVAAVAIGLASVHLVSFDAQIPQFEKALAEQFGEPVKIKALRLALLPHSHLRLEEVSIGNQAQIEVARIEAAGALGNLFGAGKAFDSLELQSPIIGEEGLAWILFGKPLASHIEFGEVTVRNAKFVSKSLSLPAFDAKLQADGAGAWKAISLESSDKNISLHLTPQNGAVALDFRANAFKLPFGSALTLEDMVATGTANRAELVLTQFKGFTYGGTLAGRARLKWGSRWSLAGEFEAKQLDLARLLPGVVDDARLAGTASYAMQAPQAAQLFAVPRVEGSFAVARGTLLGVDLGRVLQGQGMGGDTKFVDLEGTLIHEGGATQLRQLRLRQGPLAASATVDVDVDKKIRGQLAAELKLSTERVRATLALSGTPDKIEWGRR